MKNTTSKILGISAMSIGLTRAILVLEDVGILKSFSEFSFWFYLGAWLVGVLAFIGGEKG